MVTDRRVRPDVHGRPDFPARVGPCAGGAPGHFLFNPEPGVLDHCRFAGLGWIGAVFNAAMTLTGLRPFDSLPDHGAPRFAGLPALHHGRVGPTAAAPVPCPLAHRMLTTLHMHALAARIVEEGR